MLGWLIDNILPALLVTAILAVAAYVGRHWLADLWRRRPWPRISRCPRTPAETSRLLAVKPPGWEYLLFGGSLYQRLRAHEELYLDHEARYVRASDLTMTDGDFGEVMSGQTDRLRALIQNWESLINVAFVQAIGEPGQDGDPDRIQHVTSRLTASYVELIDWAARLRGARTPDRVRRLVDIAARMVDQPIKEYRDWIPEVLRQLDQVPQIIADKKRVKPVQMVLTLTITMDSAVITEFNTEIARLR